MKICKRPEWEECAYAVDTREVDIDEHGHYIWLGVIECLLPDDEICPWEEEDE